MASVKMGWAIFVLVGTFTVFSKESNASKLAFVDADEVRALGVDAKQFGEAWEQEASCEGAAIIWGDMARRPDGSPHRMDQPSAEKYCNDMGAQLPTREDFERLGEFLGGYRDPAGVYIGTGYAPTELPNLTYKKFGREYANWFWSSSIAEDKAYFPFHAYYFDGRRGELLFKYWPRKMRHVISLRCVIHR